MTKSVQFRQTRTDFFLYRQESLEATNEKVRCVCQTLQRKGLPSDLFPTVLGFCYPSVASANAKWQFSQVVNQLRNSQYLCVDATESEEERAFFTPVGRHGFMCWEDVWWARCCKYCGGFLWGSDPVSPVVVCRC